MNLVRYEGVLVRKDWGPDVAVMLEYKPTYRRMIHEVGGHRFLDIGANIGMFTVKAMENGATGGVCYEPETAALEVLQANIAPWKRKIKIVPQCIMTSSGTVELHVPKSGNATTASTFFKPRGRDIRVVKSRGFIEAIEESKASLVKFDCEGEELNFLDEKKLPGHVQIVCGELHREHGNEERCAKIIRSFRKWDAIHQPISYSYARCWVVAWKRRS